MADIDEWEYVSKHFSENKLKRWIKENEPWRMEDYENKEPKVAKESKEKEKMENELRELDKINGIGEERLKDILMLYNSKKELKEALKDNKVPLRDDVIEKLKKYYKIEEEK